MSDLVERLRAQPTERTYDSVGRAYDFPKHLVEEAIAEIERLQRELAEAQSKIAKTRDLIEWAQSDLIADARRQAFEEAADIALGIGADTNQDWPGEAWISVSIAESLRAKAQPHSETRQEQSKP